MANTYFQFKQFTVHQDKAAMKVGTDGVLLGAWAKIENCQTVLDVGTGTGLVALMIAQRNSKTAIHAIDVDNDAVQQANGNFRLSKWSDRLVAEHVSIQDYGRTNRRVLDHIVCNPPFFKNSFKSNDLARNVARHCDSLSYEELIKYSYNLLHETGRLSVVLPYDVMNEFVNIGQRTGFILSRQMLIKPTPSKTFGRVLIELSKKTDESCVYSEMIVEDKGRHGYSNEYIALTNEFYLAM
ncbi:tRNA1(Val) (adenine(37)-N6)-methyltransferase [Carboxylicivirga marina]|uniref:tRNA1(Val) (adenine(37)-N6)-methyltransferase n=1 Tax=Carboxylicivirga marina TaxID=2800988 RepID=A0ABS1HL48_9BACT|nr:methyltransferase [Carboxylicivirga marina]MBK3518397.1 methyltransferase [Carboxylicivirga marina]